MTIAMFKRAGGRRRFNKERQDLAKKRRQEIIELLLLEPDFTSGWQTWLADNLDVHSGTISRDLRRIVKDYQTTGFKGLGRRSKAKVELLNRLSEKFAKFDESRDLRNSQRKSKLTKQTKESQSKRKREAIEKQQIPAPRLAIAAIQSSARPPELAYTIPKRRSRFSRMRCFPV